MKPDLSQPQLFLDDTHIAECRYLSRTWHQAQKHVEPVLLGDTPVDYNAPVLYGTVLHWRGSFHMWYCGWTKRGIGPSACYATSDDGVHWTKPNLGLIEAFGNKDNNLIMRAGAEEGLIDNLTVIEDPDDDQWPLKMLYWEKGETKGIYLSKSSDGIHWEPGQLVLNNYGDRFNALNRRLDGRYVAFVRVPGMMNLGGGRRAWRIESEDLVHWSEPELVMASDHEDPPDMEIYSLMGFPHGDLLLGTIERMHRCPDMLDPELCWSRDGGRTWHRPRTRPAFIERPPHPHLWDSWINLSANPPIEQNGNLWFYFSGRSGSHGCDFPANCGGVGIAILRRDGYCSMRAGASRGWLRTGPITWPGGKLVVNADCRRDLTGHPRNTITGQLQIEVLDASGQTLPAYTAEAADYRINAINQTITWGPEERSLEALAGQTIQLRFHLRDAHLYSFQAR